MTLAAKDIKGRPTPKNYPLFINDKALKLWELTIKKNDAEIKSKRSLLNQWRAAIYCFQQVCVKEKIPPFVPAGSMTHKDNISDALNFINKNALWVEDLLEDITKLLKHDNIKIYKRYDFNGVDKPPAQSILCSKKMTGDFDFREFSQLLSVHFGFLKDGVGQIKKVKDPTLKVTIVETDKGAKMECYFYVNTKQVSILTDGKPQTFKKWAKKWCNSKKEITK